jgi:iron(III) transport system substrate-binding protein
MRRERLALAAVLLLAIALLAAACGGSPTAQEPSDTAGGRAEGAPHPGAARLQAVYDKVKGLSPSQRRAKLIELAEAEDGKFTVYGSTNVDEAEPIISAFKKLSDIEPSLYRASSSDVLERVLQETKAHFANGADVVYSNGPEMQVLDDRGLLLPLNSPYTKDLVQQTVVSKNWMPIYLNAFTAAWNTRRVTPAQAPKTWADVLDRFSGKLAMEVGDWDWFATLVTQYFEKQQGMSEAQAVALFRRAAGGARMIDGHTLMTQLLASGEFGAAASTYKHRVARLKADGAPIQWEPPVQPIVIRPNGVGISADTDAPASSLLFADFMMTDVQKMLIGFDRTPASNAVPGGGIPSKYKVLIADLRTLNAQRQKWEDLYEQIARRSGKVIDE